jgi:HTH-type transcriptional regulator/antitoxin HigA
MPEKEVKEMDIRPIRTEADYDAALAEIEQFFDNEPAHGTPEADRFDILSALIGDYERKHWRINPPSDAVEAIQTVMRQRGYTQDFRS